LNTISLKLLALQVVEYEKEISQQQQALINLHKEKRQFYALSVEGLLSLQKRIEQDLRLGKLSALEYELMKGLLEDRLGKLKRDH
jgi:hypothetical protein